MKFICSACKLSTDGEYFWSCCNDIDPLCEECYEFHINTCRFCQRELFEAASEEV